MTVSCWNLTDMFSRSQWRGASRSNQFDLSDEQGVSQILVQGMRFTDDRLVLNEVEENVLLIEVKMVVWLAILYRLAP